jgi:hypothetical protein
VGIEASKTTTRSPPRIARSQSSSLAEPANRVGSSDGLAGAEVQRALSVAQEAHDAHVMRLLRVSLDQIMSRKGAAILDRRNALALLRAVSDGLKPATVVVVGRTSAGQSLVVDHPAVANLDELIDAIADLDQGKTHLALKPASRAANASLSTKQRKRDNALLEAVLVIRQANGFRTRSEAEHELAKNLREAGYQRNGKPITAVLLKRLRDNAKRRKPLKT